VLLAILSTEFKKFRDHLHQRCTTCGFR